MITPHHTAKGPIGKEGKIQSMLFKKPKWTVKKAKTWLSKNGYKYDDVDEKEEHLRFRQVSPSYMESRGFHFITRPFGTSGIEAIIGYKEKDPVDIKKEEREDLMIEKIKQVADDLHDLRSVHGTGVFDKILDHMSGRGIHIDIDSHNAKGARSSTGEGIFTKNHKDIIERAKKTLGMGFKKGSPEAKAHMAKIRAIGCKKASSKKFEPKLDDTDIYDFDTPKKGKGFVKGSQEAKDHMAKIRSMRKN